MLINFAKNLYVNVVALVSSAGLSVVNMIQLFDGVLPSISLVVTTCATAALLVYHIRNTRRVDAEHRLTELKAQELEIRLEQMRRALRDTVV